MTTTVTPDEMLESAVGELAAHKRTWAHLPISRKVGYLRRMHERVGRCAEEWVRRAAAIKLIEPDSPWIGEEWISGPYALLEAISAVAKTLDSLAAGDDPLASRPVRTRPDGQVIVEVFPDDIYDKVLLTGFKAEVWMDPDVGVSDLSDTVAGFYKREPGDGQVGLILGAGNITSIPMLDLLSKMFTEGQVVIVKLNPVTDLLGPVFEEICGELIADGFVRFAYGGHEVGGYLINHAAVDALHITGSETSYNAIVYGPGDEGRRRREVDQPLITKPFSAELGGVGPTIVVPGPWTSADLTYHAEHLASQKMHNAGCNCVASQVVVLSEGWSHSSELLDRLRATFDQLPRRAPYYPGADERHAAAVDAHPAAENFGPDHSGPTLIVGLDADADEYAFGTEFFGAVLASAMLPEDDPLTFLRRAVQFANGRLVGTLGAQILIHPKTLKEMGPAFESALADLRYGSIGVNCWSGAGYAIPTMTWGAFPGHTRSDIGSGTGVVHNALMFDRPQKSIAYGPFRPFPDSLLGGARISLKPPWFVTHANGHTVGERLTQLAADKKPWRLLPVVMAALRH